MKDTIICAASEESFNSLFRDQGMWASVEIDKNIRNDLKYCALYRTKEGMITDYAEIIEDIGIIELPQSAQKEGMHKCIILFKSGTQTSFKKPIECEGMRGRIYTQFKKLDNESRAEKQSKLTIKYLTE